jgi:hypothetical protein
LGTILLGNVGTTLDVNQLEGDQVRTRDAALAPLTASWGQ